MFLPPAHCTALSQRCPRGLPQCLIPWPTSVVCVTCLDLEKFQVEDFLFEIRNIQCYCKVDKARNTMAYGRRYRKGTCLLPHKATRGQEELKTTQKISSSLGGAQQLSNCLVYKRCEGLQILVTQTDRQIHIHMQACMYTQTHGAKRATDFSVWLSIPKLVWCWYSLTLTSEFPQKSSYR